ncbi:MAG TPA: hypothetical protein DEP84_33770 [Chloroflexi bacterium]|nr:hypothetical protein [Chloroflexota bacterium]
MLLYGSSLILGTVGVSLKRYPHLEIVSLTPPLPATEEVGALMPDVIIFDVEAARPESAISLLEVRPRLLLIGIGPSSDRMLLWSGQHSRALTMQDLVQAINSLPGPSDASFWSLHTDRLRQAVAARTPILVSFTRQQRLAFAVAALGLCVVLLLGLLLANPIPNAPLAGTAVSGGAAPQMELLIAGGLVLGAMLIGVWLRHSRRH